MYGKNHYNIIKLISLQLIKINGKNKFKKIKNKRLLKEKKKKHYEFQEAE